jgi:hypothetical protein
MAHKHNVVTTTLAGIFVGCLLSAGAVVSAHVIELSHINPNAVIDGDRSDYGAGSRYRDSVTEQNAQMKKSASEEKDHCQGLSGTRLTRCRVLKVYQLRDSVRH